MKFTITWNSLLPDVVDGAGLTNHEELLKHLQIAKQQLEEEWKFFEQHGHRWPKDQRQFEIEGDRGLILNSMSGQNSSADIMWEHTRVVEMISSTEQMLSAKAAEKPKRKGPKLDDESVRILDILTKDPSSKATQIVGTLYPKVAGDTLNQEVTRIGRKLTYLKKNLHQYEHSKS